MASLRLSWHTNRIHRRGSGQRMGRVPWHGPMGLSAGSPSWQQAAWKGGHGHVTLHTDMAHMHGVQAAGHASARGWLVQQSGHDCVSMSIQYRCAGACLGARTTLHMGNTSHVKHGHAPEARRFRACRESGDERQTAQEGAAEAGSATGTERVIRIAGPCLRMQRGRMRLTGHAASRRCIL